MKNFVFTLILGVLLVAMSTAQAADKHNHDSGHGSDHHGSNSHDDMSNGKDAMFLEKKEVDGYVVSFHIMKAKPGKEMGGSHDVMIQIKKDNKILMDLELNTKVFYPDRTSDVKEVMKMGDWYMAGYDMGNAGEHQVMVLFKTKDGKKHLTGIYY